MASGTITNDNAVTVDTISLTGFDSAFTLQRVGKICFLTYNGTASNLENGDLSFSQVLPAKFIPANQTWLPTDSSTAKYNVCVLLKLNTNGTISGYNYSGGAITSRVACRFGTVSYVAAN